MRLPLKTGLLSTALGAALLWLGAAWATQALGQTPHRPGPLLFTLFPAGGQAGKSLDLEIICIEGNTEGRLVFSHPGITARQKMRPPSALESGERMDIREISTEIMGSNRSVKVRRFSVTIAPNVPQGFYELRLASRYGLSNPRTFCVGTLPEVVEDIRQVAPDEGNHSAEQAIPVKFNSVINGRVDGKSPDWFRFTAKKGQRLLADCLTHDIDTGGQPLLTIRNQRGRELAASRGKAFIDFTVPVDSDYFITVRDLNFGGAPLLNNQTKKWRARNHALTYRLTLYTGPRVEAIFPSAGKPGASGQFTVYGRNLPGGKPGKLLGYDGRPLEELSVQITLPAKAGLKAEQPISSKSMGIDGISWRLNEQANPIFISQAREKVILETEPNDDPGQAQAVELPCEIVGRFFPRRDRDWVTFKARKGEAFWVEVIAHRLGQPVDPAFTVQRLNIIAPEDNPEKGEDGEKKVPEQKWVEVLAVDDLRMAWMGARTIFTPGHYSFPAGTYDPWGGFVAPEDGTYRVLTRLTDPSHNDPTLSYRLLLQRAKQVERWSRPATDLRKHIVSDKGDFRLAVLPWHFAEFSSKPKPSSEKGLALPKGGTLLLQLVAFRQGAFQEPIEVSAEGLPAGVTCQPTTIGPWKTLAPLVLQAAPNAAPWQGRIRVVGRVGQQIHEARVATRVNGRTRMVRDGLMLAVTTENHPFRVESPKQVWATSRAGKLEIPFKILRQPSFKGSVTPTLFPGQIMDTTRKPLVNVSSVTVNGNNGILKLDIPTKHPPGIYSYFVNVSGAYDYNFKPEILAQEVARQKELDTLLLKLQAAAKKAADLNAVAQKILTEAQTAAKAATTKLTAAKPEEKAAAQQVVNQANQALERAQEKQKASAEALSVANGKASTANKVKMEQDNVVTKAKTIYKTHKLTHTTLSTPITLNIAPAPIELVAVKPAATKQGGKLELSVTVKRLGGYKDPISLSVNFPSDLKGIKATAAPIPAGQTQGKFTLELQPNATTGKFTSRVIVTAKLNGQTLTHSQPLNLTIESAPPVTP